MTKVEKVRDAIMDYWLKHGTIDDGMAKAVIKATRKQVRS